MTKGVCALLCAIVLLAWTQNVRSFDWYCSYLIHTQCLNQPKDQQCGSNNYTYYNKCEFSQDHCRNRNIHLAHNGTCHVTSHLSSMTHGADVIFQTMCASLISCPYDFNQICASDGKTYANECEYEMKRCMHPEMYIVARQPCA